MDGEVNATEYYIYGAYGHLWKNLTSAIDAREAVISEYLRFNETEYVAASSYDEYP